jgi:hypothetical protein
VSDRHTTTLRARENEKKRLETEFLAKQINSANAMTLVFKELDELREFKKRHLQ